MKSDAEIKSIFYSLLRGSELSATISGQIYKTPRPKNSDKEDITIMILDGRNGQFQDAVVNVNIYIPDSQNGLDSFSPDELRIRELSDLSIKLLDGQVTGKYRMSIEKQPVFQVEGVNQHCINNRVLFTIKNFK